MKQWEQHLDLMSQHTHTMPDVVRGIILSARLISHSLTSNISTRAHRHTHTYIHTYRSLRITLHQCFTVKPKSAHKWRNYRLSSFLLLLLFYIWRTKHNKKLYYNIYFSLSLPSLPLTMFHRGILHFGICSIYIYILILFEELLRSTRYTVAITANWHYMRLIKWISTHTHCVCAVCAGCADAIFFFFLYDLICFDSILKISRIVPIFISECALCEKGKRLFRLNIRHTDTHIHIKNHKVGH